MLKQIHFLLLTIHSAQVIHFLPHKSLTMNNPSVKYVFLFTFSDVIFLIWCECLITAWDHEAITAEQCFWPKHRLQSRSGPHMSSSSQSGNPTNTLQPVSLRISLQPCWPPFGCSHKLLKVDFLFGGKKTKQGLLLNESLQTSQNVFNVKV